MSNEESLKQMAEAQKLINQRAMYAVPTRSKTDRLIVPITITGFRLAYGRLEFMVTPVGGMGFAWVNADRIVKQERANGKS